MRRTGGKICDSRMGEKERGRKRGVGREGQEERGRKRGENIRGGREGNEVGREGERNIRVWRVKEGERER